MKSGLWGHGFVLILVGMAGLAGPLGPQVVAAQYEERLCNPDTLGQEARRDPVVARLETGGVLALWSDNARGHTDIMARTFDADLNGLADPSRVNSDPGYFGHGDIDIDANDAGVISSVWVTERSDRDQIYTQLFRRSDGSPIGPDRRIDVELGFEDSRTPRICTNAAGTSLAAWVNIFEQQDRVFLQFIDDQGMRLGENFVAPAVDSQQRQNDPTIGALPNNRWILAWAEEGQPDEDWDIFYQLLESDGSPIGEIRQANTDLIGRGRQGSPEILVRDTDILLVWTDNRQGTSDIWGRWLDLDGVPEAGDALMREASDPGPDDRPELTPGLDGAFALSWFGTVGNDQRAMVKYFNPDRSPLTESVPMDTPFSGVAMRDGRVLPQPDATWIHFWSDNRLQNPDIYAQLYDPLDGPASELKTLWISEGSTSQIYGDVALFPDGRAITVWADMKNGPLAIWARILDQQGDTTGVSFQVNEQPAGALFDTIDEFDQLLEFAPSVAASGDGFVVTWAIDREGGRLNVWGQLFDAQGNKIGSNFEIAEGQSGSPQLDARPVMYSDGDFAIVYWLSIGSSSDGIFLQRYLANGQPDGDRVAVVDSDARAAPQLRPEITADPFDQTVVVWMDYRGGGNDIWGQKFDPEGGLVGPNFALHADDGPNNDQVSPSVAVASDRIVAVWDDRPSFDGLISGRLEIFPSFAPGTESESKAGSREVIDFVVNAGSATQGAKHPKVAVGSEGRFIVTWWDNHDGQTGLFAQRFDAFAAPIGEAYELHTTEELGSRLPPKVDVDGSRIQFVWSDSRRDMGWDIYARRVDWEFSGDPIPVALSGWTAESTPEGIELSWATSLDLGLSLFHVWRDTSMDLERGPSESALRLTLDGIAPSPDGAYIYLDRTPPVRERLHYYLQSIEENGDTEYFGPFESVWDGPLNAHLRVGPNPFQSQVRLTPSVRGPYRFMILDVTGRVVNQLAGHFEGEDPPIWDGRDTQGRPVPAGLYFVRSMPVTGRGSTVGAESIKVLRVR